MVALVRPVVSAEPLDGLDEVGCAGRQLELTDTGGGAVVGIGATRGKFDVKGTDLVAPWGCTRGPRIGERWYAGVGVGAHDWVGEWVGEWGAKRPLLGAFWPAPAAGR